MQALPDHITLHAQEAALLQALATVIWQVRMIITIVTLFSQLGIVQANWMAHLHTGLHNSKQHKAVCEFVT